MLISPDLAPTHRGYADFVRQNEANVANPPEISDAYLARFMRGMLVPTCGNLFRGVELAGAPTLSRRSPSRHCRRRL